MGRPITEFIDNEAAVDIDNPSVKTVSAVADELTELQSESVPLNDVADFEHVDVSQAFQAGGLVALR